MMRVPSLRFSRATTSRRSTTGVGVSFSSSEVKSKGTSARTDSLRPRTRCGPFSQRKGARKKSNKKKSRREQKSDPTPHHKSSRYLICQKTVCHSMWASSASSTRDRSATVCGKKRMMVEAPRTEQNPLITAITCPKDLLPVCDGHKRGRQRWTERR